MKNKIVIFILGVLVGAIIATGGFFLYENSRKKGFSSDKMKQMMENKEFNGEMPNLKDGNDKGNFDFKTRPSKSDKDKKDTENSTNNANSSSTPNDSNKNGNTSQEKTEPNNTPSSTTEATT